MRTPTGKHRGPNIGSAARLGVWRKPEAEVPAVKTLKITLTFRNDNPNTIWNRLAAKLGRQPTHAEARAEVARILAEAGGSEMTGIRHIYSTNNGGAPGIYMANPNRHGSAIIIGMRDSVGDCSIGINGPTGYGYAILDREELRLIYEALRKEFQQ